jgi:hypothetical protein
MRSKVKNIKEDADPAVCGATLVVEDKKPTTIVFRQILFA